MSTTIYYCKKTNGFVFESSDDCIPVELDHHEDFFSQPQPIGTKLVVSDDGQLSYAPIEYTDTELEVFARKRRNSLLQRYIDGLNSFRLAELSAEEQNVAAKFRLELLDVPQQEGFPQNIDWPEVPACLRAGSSS